MQCLYKHPALDQCDSEAINNGYCEEHLRHPSVRNDLESSKIIECDECDEEEAVGNSGYTKHAAEQEGWYFGVTNDRTICPKCNSLNLNEQPLESASDDDNFSSAS